MEKLHDIIRNSGMSTRPEYYSGRGATLSDLNSNILQKIYLGIEEHYGKKAAKNYVKMVADIKVLSATTFLQELYMLFNSDWKYTKKKNHASGIDVPKDEDGNYDLDMGMIGVLTAMMHSGRDDTMSIKAGFLNTHGVKGKERYVVDEFGRNYIYYE